MQAELGLADIGIAYGHPILEHVSVQAELFSTYFAPLVRHRRAEGGVRSTPLQFVEVGAEGAAAAFFWSPAVMFTKPAGLR